MEEHENYLINSIDLAKIVSKLNHYSPLASTYGFKLCTICFAWIQLMYGTHVGNAANTINRNTKEKNSAILLIHCSTDIFLIMFLLTCGNLLFFSRSRRFTLILYFYQRAQFDKHRIHYKNMRCKEMY